MRSDFQLKAYEYMADRCSCHRQSGDRWMAVGVVRVNGSALQRAIRREPAFYALGEAPVAIEYGPGDWRILAVWGTETLVQSRTPEEKENAGRIWRIPADALLPFLWEEEDVRRYLDHWNYVISYQERRLRMNNQTAATAEEQELPLSRKDMPRHRFPASRPGMQAASGGYENFSKRTMGYPLSPAIREQAWTAILSAVPAAREEAGGGELSAGEFVQEEQQWNPPMELMTRGGRWFGVYRKQEQLYICEAKYMKPACPITFDRRIRRREVDALLPLYGEWVIAADEESIRRQARQISISYEYIFTIIRQYAIG